MVHNSWANLPVELLTVTAQKLSLMEDSVLNILNFSGVCKSWKSAILNLKSEDNPLILRLTQEEKERLSPKYPWLLLAEPTATMPFKWDDGDDRDHRDEEEEEDNDYGVEEVDDDEEVYNNDGVEVEEEEDNNNFGVEEEDNDEQDNNDDEDLDEGHEHGDDNVDGNHYEEDNYNHKNNSIGNVRGLFSLSTRKTHVFSLPEAAGRLIAKTHVFSLPEAAGRLIAGTNIGWLVTLGRDFQINLLHPLLRRQIPLPPMLTFPTHQEYHERYLPEEATLFFVHKVVLSSRISTLSGLQVVDVSPPPTVMTIYGATTKLGFAKLGDESWTDVNGPWGNFYDIVYHKERFYGVDCYGNVYTCDIDNDRQGGAIGTKIASLPAGTHHHQNHKYLVESLCGSYLYLVVRVRKYNQGIYKYLTTEFSVWKFQVDYDDSDIPRCKWAKVRSLKNKTLFVGRTPSLCVRTTGCLKSNCIYFTDDYWEGYLRGEGGYDMGIYNLKTGTIKPHFQRIIYSSHLSPTLVYLNY